MENMQRINVYKAIKMKEKNINLLSKIYGELKEQLNNCNDKKETEIAKYNLLVVLYTYYEEFQKKERYKYLYYLNMMPHHNNMNKKDLISVDLNSSVKTILNHKLEALNIYLNNSKEFERIIKYGNENLLIQNYNLSYSDVKLVKFVINNYKNIHKNDNNQKKIK